MPIHKYKIQASYVVSIFLPIVLHELVLGIRYCHDTVVCPSTCPWRRALWLNDTSYTAKVCLNKWIGSACPPRNTMLHLSTHDTDHIPSNCPPL